jgi:energy-coupling factor transporter ATP-binding protein EcfA2
MAPEDCRPGPAPRLGLMLAWVGGAGGYLLGLAVAAVLALRPPVIILDEPTTGLDHREQEDMLALIQDLHAQGHTVIMVTHSMWAASRYARRLIVLRAGRVVLDGPTRVVFAQEERLAACGLRQEFKTSIGQKST